MEQPRKNELFKTVQCFPEVILNMIMDYQRPYVMRHSMRPDSYSTGYDERTMFWPCCKSEYHDSEGCKCVQYPLDETQPDWNNKEKWMHPGKFHFLSQYWTCCRQITRDSKGCEYKDTINATDFEHAPSWTECEGKRTYHKRCFDCNQEIASTMGCSRKRQHRSS